MKRRFLAIAATAAVAALTLTPGSAHAGGVAIATAACSTDGVTVTWNHIAEAIADEANGTIRAVELISIVTFGEAVPRTLTASEVSRGVWKVDPFAAVGAVTIDVTLRETITQPGGSVYVATTTPRTTFTCAAPPVTTTTIAPSTTTTLAPTTTAAPTTVPAPATTTTLLPTTTVAGTTTTVASSILPETGTQDSALLVAGAILLLAGCSLTLSTQLRRRNS